MSALFANLLLAHFLSDFPLQWDRMVADKRQKLLRGFGSLEAAGLTIAAKSLLRFNDDDGPRTEYVLAGTLLSLLIALACAAALYCFVLDVDVIGIIKAGVTNARS